MQRGCTGVRAEQLTVLYVVLGKGSGATLVTGKEQAGGQVVSSQLRHEHRSRGRAVVAGVQ